MSAEAVSGPIVRVVREFGAPVGRAFRAWTDPDDVAKWMWGGLGKNVTAEVDLRRGGRYSVYTDAASAAEGFGDRWGMRGLYIDIQPDKRLVYTLHWDAPVVYNQQCRVPDEVVIVEFAANGDGTQIVYVHHGIPDQQAAGEHTKGVEDTFDHLARLLT